jgi:UDP-N-acetyl-2-amino-2-deoxyglucuronate dehydrogenase
MIKRFGLIGVAGYIAPRHLRAIRETGNVLVAAMDPSDSVGVIDSYFPEADFFTEFERFDRHVDKLRRRGCGLDYVSICSPNYSHDAHIRFALRNGADAICEKPVVLNPWNLDALREIEQETGQRVFTIHQLRLHPALIELRNRIKTTRVGMHDVDVTYITSRGRWYQYSWKGNVEKSGGVATNIGLHFFDILTWIFGPLVESTVHINRPDCAAGFIRLQCAQVRWFLSVNAEHLPDAQKQCGQRTFRSITVDGAEVEFSEGFTGLHTESYRQILVGSGFGLEAARHAVQTVYQIRQSSVSRPGADCHPLTRLSA